MLDYAVKLTKDPTAMQESDIQTLRAAGLTDEQILSVVGITCLFNFMNRLADGLGVAVEPERQTAMTRRVTGPARQSLWLWGNPPEPN